MEQPIEDLDQADMRAMASAVLQTLHEKFGFVQSGYMISTMLCLYVAYGAQNDHDAALDMLESLHIHHQALVIGIMEKVRKASAPDGEVTH